MFRRSRTVQSRHSRGFRSRRGFALMMALGALVILAVLIAGSTYISIQESRLGQNQLVQSRAFAVAEYGLNKIQADWDKTPNLQMENGASFDTTYILAGQGTCAVRYTRLNNETFWIVSKGEAVVGNSLSRSRTAVKRMGAVLRLRIPTIKANAAVTTAGNVVVKGSPQIRGMNQVPAGWTGCTAAPDKAGLVTSPTATVTIQNANQVVGSPNVATDPLAADQNTYVKFGDETWNTLTSAPNVSLAGGSYGSAIGPTVTAGSCAKENLFNWGEPNRSGTGLVPECYNYFPIIYVAGDLALNGNGRGQGILLINGNLQINGTFDWTGLIVTAGKILKGNGSATVTGAIMAAEAEVTDELQGNLTVNYSACGLERAMRGSAQVVQARERAWAEIY